MSELWIGIAIAAFTFLLSWGTKIYRRVKNNCTALKALRGEIEINQSLAVHNQSRVQQYVDYNIDDFPSFILYRNDMILAVINQIDIDVADNLRDEMKELLKQLLHQNELLRELRYLWEIRDANTFNGVHLQLLAREVMAYMNSTRDDDIFRLLKFALDSVNVALDNHPIHRIAMVWRNSDIRSQISTR